MQRFLAVLSLGLLFSNSLFAQSLTYQGVDTGDTAWVIVASALVLFMSIPGLALFYGGLVRRKNVLSVFMQIFILVAVISVEWLIVGYSNAFGTNSNETLKPFIGGFDWAFLRNININDLSPYYISHSNIAIDGSKTGTIPHMVFVLFQCMFAAITPALIIGAFAERINFKGFLLFSVLWSLLIYNPIVHWVWSPDGWLYKRGALDFAGGIVVHISAGIAAIVTALMIGKRRDYKGHALPPHSIPQVAIGTGMLWVGWFGFNGGSGLSSDGLAGSAIISTHMAAASAAITWGALEWFIDKKATVIGICTGAIAGLATITGASGFVSVQSAAIIGVIASLICFSMVAYIKPRLGYDDALDAFGVHGIGGITGVILTGIFASPFVQSQYSGLIYGNPEQLKIQAIATITVILFTAVGTFLIFKLTDKIVGVRADDKAEAIGLDEAEHGETAYTYFD
jgi:ammonium transporter, Amt family